MTFSQEYERMRPLDEDDGGVALEFTLPRERSFDSRLWFIDTYLPSRTYAGVGGTARKPKPPKSLDEELEEHKYQKRVQEFKLDEQQRWLSMLSSQRECWCGAYGTYAMHDRWVCINHVNSTM